jgi:hypothetical protein
MASFEFLAIIFTGLGLIVSILYYTTILQNANKTQQMQLETRQGQLIMQVYHKFSTLETANAFQKFTEIRNKIETPDDLLDEWVNNSENYESMWILGTFFEGVGVLVKENLLEIRLVAELMTGPLTEYWVMFAPHIDEVRERGNTPRMLAETEYLYNTLINYVEEHPEISA